MTIKAVSTSLSGEQRGLARAFGGKPVFLASLGAGACQGAYLPHSLLSGLAPRQPYGSKTLKIGLRSQLVLADGRDYERGDSARTLAINGPRDADNGSRVVFGFGIGIPKHWVGLQRQSVS
jgi:hypothetical protein